MKKGSRVCWEGGVRKDLMSKCHEEMHVPLKSGAKVVAVGPKG